MTTKNLSSTTEIDSIEKKRLNRNCNVFIAAFTFVGLINGISLDAFVSFLQLKNPSVASAYSTFWGLSILISAFVLVFVTKLGYKKMLLPFSFVIIGSMIGIMYLNNSCIISILTILFLTGANLMLYFLAPMLSAYTTLENRTKIFARALYANLIGTALATLFDGNLVVYFFSKFLHVNYAEADKLSSAPTLLTLSEKLEYFKAFKVILWAVCAIALIVFIILLFLKERKKDYIEEKQNDHNSTKNKFNFGIFKSKDIIVWLIFSFSIGFGAALICPYFPIYLNQYLHIERGTVSIILALTYVASVIFMMLSPKFEKKFGSVASIGGLFLCAIPIFFILANGKLFGSFMVIGVGITLFIRSGLANASQPITQALPMSFVKKSERAEFNAVVSALQAFGYIFGGIFTKYFLFSTIKGYATAYYVSALFYGIAGVIVLVFLFKKYNRYTENNKIDEIDEFSAEEIS